MQKSEKPIPYEDQIDCGPHEKAQTIRMTYSPRALSICVGAVLVSVSGHCGAIQASALDSDVDDEVITVPFDPRPVPSSKQAHHTLRWRHVPAHSILLKELKTGTTLYQFESQKKLSPASLTKIMSASGHPGIWAISTMR